MNRQLTVDEHEGMERSDSSRAPRLGRRLVGELLMMGAVFAIYRQIRFLTRNDTDAAMDNAERVVDFERRSTFLRARRRTWSGTPHARRLPERALTCTSLDRRIPALGSSAIRRLSQDKEHFRQRPVAAWRSRRFPRTAR